MTTFHSICFNLQAVEKILNHKIEKKEPISAEDLVGIRDVVSKALDQVTQGARELELAGASAGSKLRSRGMSPVRDAAPSSPVDRLLSQAQAQFSERNPPAAARAPSPILPQRKGHLYLTPESCVKGTAVSYNDTKEGVVDTVFQQSNDRARIRILWNEKRELNGRPVPSYFDVTIYPDQTMFTITE